MLTCQHQQWLVIKSVEIIFRPYYFVKLFGSINSRKSILQNHIVLKKKKNFIGENLLCCTKMVTSLVPNKAINFSNDCNKPPASKGIHHSVEQILPKTPREYLPWQPFLESIWWDIMIPI